MCSCKCLTVVCRKTIRHQGIQTETKYSELIPWLVKACTWGKNKPTFLWYILDNTCISLDFAQDWERASKHSYLSVKRNNNKQFRNKLNSKEFIIMLFISFSCCALLLKHTFHGFVNFYLNKILLQPIAKKKTQWKLNVTNSIISTQTDGSLCSSVFPLTATAASILYHPIQSFFCMVSTIVTDNAKIDTFSAR